MLKKILGVFFLIVILMIGGAWMDYQRFITAPIIVDKVHLIEIKKGSSFNRIMQCLIREKISINTLWFKIFAYQQGLIKELKAGEYQLPVGLTAKQFLLLLTSGKVQKYSITFPEGWTFKQMRMALAKHKALKHDSTTLTNHEILKEMQSVHQHPEGLFFPDTYQFEKNTSDKVILKQAYQKMQRVLSQAWKNKVDNLPLKTAYEALILASIIEKETGSAMERTKISGVFIRRLNKGMRLQTDPTVIYGMGERYQGNISKKDLKTVTAYNTYKIKGLPPTPIAMPGKAAIDAALHPDDSDNLYFVAKGTAGEHVFSSNYAAHNNAVNQYQRGK